MLIKFLLSKQFYLPIIYIIVGIIIYFIICNIINKLKKVNNKHINTKKQNTIISLFKTILKVIIIIIVLLMILSVYGINTTSIIASLSVIGVVIGFAFQDILKNLLAGITIIFDDHYSIGDNVSINGFRGDVISLGLQTTKVKAYTGEIFVVGNSSITNIINYSADTSKLVIDLCISYETDINKVEVVLENIKSKIEKIDDVIGEIELLGIEELADSSIKYRIALDCKSMTHFGVKRKILKLVKEEFDKNNIKIPYNQLEIYINNN